MYRSHLVLRIEYEETGGFFSAGRQLVLEFPLFDSPLSIREYRLGAIGFSERYVGWMKSALDISLECTVMMINEEDIRTIKRIFTVEDLRGGLKSLRCSIERR